MDFYIIKWPDGFDDYAWEIQSKGWFNGLEILVNGRIIKLTFYDGVRLLQDINEEIGGSGYYCPESSLIVLEKVCRELMEKAIAELAKSGRLQQMNV